MTRVLIGLILALLLLVAALAARTDALPDRTAPLRTERTAVQLVDTQFVPKSERLVPRLGPSPLVLPKPNSGVPPQRVHEASLPLFTKGDASSRIEAARVIRGLAELDRSQPLSQRSDAQMLAILRAAYDQEQNWEVRVAIVNTIAECDEAEAAELLNRAMEDRHPAVRRAATQAKEIRQRRIASRW